MAKIVLIQGLPGSGKTTLAQFLKEQLRAIHINADWARGTITSHLGFRPADRIKQATALAQMSRMVQEQGQWVIVDFVCPTKETRSAFYDTLKFGRSDVFSIWMDTIETSRFEDTNKLYQKPGVGAYDSVVKGYRSVEELQQLAVLLANEITNGHKSYYIRYNTQSDGKSKHWRIIDAVTKEETLVDDFELRGLMTPGSTVEHNQLKWNVLVRGFGSFVTEADGAVRFILTY